MTLLSTTDASIGSSMGPGAADSDQTDPDRKEEMDLLAAQAKLMKLIDSWDPEFYESPRCDLSDESRHLFRRFIRGYVSSGCKNKHGSQELPDHVEGIAGSWQLSNFLDLDRSRTEGDHYEFFARMPGNPSERVANPQDNDRRLQLLRIHQIRCRVAHQPVQDYFMPEGYHDGTQESRRGGLTQENCAALAHIAAEAERTRQRRESRESSRGKKPSTAPAQIARPSALKMGPGGRSSGRSNSKRSSEEAASVHSQGRLTFASPPRRGVDETAILALQAGLAAENAPCIQGPRGRQSRKQLLTHTHQSAVLEEGKRAKRGTMATQDMRAMRNARKLEQELQWDGLSDSSDEDQSKAKRTTLSADSSPRKSMGGSLGRASSAGGSSGSLSMHLFSPQASTPRAATLPRALSQVGSRSGSAQGRSRSTSRSRRRKRQTVGGPGRVSATSAAATAALKAEMRTKEACESLRFLVFGCDVPYGRGKEGTSIFEQKCGTREEVMQLYCVWNQMDEDGSGDVEFQEFLSFFSRSKADRLLGMRCVKYLVGNQPCDNGDDKPDGCCIEDMMRLIWLKSTPEDINRMMHWFREAEFQNDRAGTPPLLPRRKRREVIENFPLLEAGQTITFQDLVESGLVDEATSRDLRDQYDRDGSSRISEDLLLEMLCPNGYRSHPDAHTAIDKMGRPLLYVENGIFTGWIVASKASKWEKCHQDMQKLHSQQLVFCTEQRRNSREKLGEAPQPGRGSIIGLHVPHALQ